MNINNIIEAQRYLSRFTPSGATQVYSGGMALERPRAFYKLLNNPQNLYKVIHIAGTSGKGSTCHYISHLLHSQGFTVGLSISPHLYDIRERLQVNNELISETDFCTYLSEIIPAIEQMKDSEFGFPTYFEIIQGLAFYAFAKKKVDYAVMETGLGGRFDPTNTVTRQDKIAVITKIGFDHQHILGNTLSKIALEKAKIIQQHNIVLAIEQKSQVEQVINQVAQEEKTTVSYITNKTHIKNITTVKDGIQYDFSFGNLKLEKLRLNSFGLFQSENSGLALAVLQTLSKRDGFTINESKICQTLQSVTIAGRMEFTRYKNKTFILDGAHNPQKMQTFVKSLGSMYLDKKLLFIIAVKKTKEVKEMLKYIVPLAQKIIITKFSSDTDKQVEKNIEISKEQAAKIQGYISLSMDPAHIADKLDGLSFTNYRITKTLPEAVELALKENVEPIVITGSLYLVGNTQEIFDN